MSTDRTHSSILLVGATHDEVLDHCADALRRSGRKACMVDDVYAAMALLARDSGVESVLVDIRGLDRMEAAFISLAPRYFPSVEFAVALLDGSTERLQSLNISCECVTPQAFITRWTAGGRGKQHAATRPPAPPTKAPDQKTPRIENPPEDAKPLRNESSTPMTAPPQGTQPRGLSTDGGPGDAPEGPSLHEAVRARMQGLAGSSEGGNDPRRIRRRPPSAATAPATKHPEEMPAQITDEELSALLAPDPTEPSPDGEDTAP